MSNLVVTQNQTEYSMAKRQDQYGVSFESFLRNWHDFIRREQVKTRKLIEMSMTIHRRDRGLTISDQYGGYGTRPTTEGRWMDYRPDEDGEIYPINIVHEAISTNKSACLQSNSETIVKSANESAEHKQVAMRWQKFADYFERTGWDESKRGFIFDATQKDGTIMVKAVLRKGDSQTVPSINEKKTGLAVYQCANCKTQGVTQTENVPTEEEAGDDMANGFQSEVDCPQCGAPAPAMVKPIAGYNLDEEETETVEITDELIPFYNFTIDTYGAKIGGIKTAKWLQIQRLRDRPYMESTYQHLNFAGAEQWCYQLRCDYALATADWGYLNSWSRSSGFTDFDRIQEDSIYLHEDAYANYRAPADYEFINAAGKKTFSIKQGQSIDEAQKAMYGEDCEGFMFVWSDERLLDIPTPETECLNFRDAFSDVHWSRTSGSYHSSPNYSLVTIQDTITLVNTLKMTTLARNAVNPVYFNSLVFDEGDFSKEYIGTSKAALLPDHKMQGGVYQLPVPTPSPYLDEQLRFLFEIKDGVSQVTPAMRGEKQPGAPYAAQRQQLEQSYGNLTPVLKSFSQCKIDTFLNKAKLAKKHYTLEQFQRVGSMFGELWGEEDVAEMCDIDFDRDLIVTYREGSEMPATPISQELQFFGTLQQLGAMPPDVLLQVITPDKWAKIIEKAGEFGNLGFDVSGMEIDEMIAQKRYIELAKICNQYGDVTFDQIEQMRTKVVAVQPPTPEAMQQAIQLAQSAPDDPNVQAQAKQMATPQPIYALDLITEEIFHQSQIRFSTYEDLGQQNEFFVEMLRTEMGKTKPNYVLFEMLNVLLGMLQQAIDGLKKQEMASDPQIQAAAAADEAAKQDRQTEFALQAEKQKNDDQNKKAEIALKAKEVDIEAHQSDRDALLKMTEGSGKGETADKGPSESISLKDLPEKGQVQMAKQAGIDISESDVKAHMKATKPVPAAKPASKPTAKKK